MNYFAANLRYLMKRLGVTQIWLAGQMELGQSTISNWLNRVGSPDVENLIKLHQVFDISIDKLVMENLERTGSVTDTMVKNFKEKGSLQKAKVKPYKLYEGSSSIVEEPDPGTWIVIELMKGIKHDIGNVQKIVDRIDRNIKK